MDELNSTLQEKLKEKLSETGLSVNALEKQAGLKRSAVQNILHGKSKRPSADILLAISKILGCTMSDLLGQADNSTARIEEHSLLYSSPANDDGYLNTDLYINAVKRAQKNFTKHRIHPSKQEALNYIYEIYQYSANTDSKEIDPRFAEWLLNKIILMKK